MSKEIKNRRENIIINEIPPEILDKISLETALSTDGFVKNTDYPTGSTGGVVKLSAGYGSAVGATGSTEGILMGVQRTLAQYNSATNTLIISKGTLENVIFPVVIAKMQADMGELYENAEVGDTWTVLLRKTTDGLVFDYAPTE